MQVMINMQPEIPAEVLKDVDLHPAHMDKFPLAHLHAKKAEAVKNQIRRALFRQALFKVQNVEVMHDCRDTRVIENVSELEVNFLTRKLSANPPVRQELWTIDRCNTKAVYRVTYHKEGADGFSTQVTPLSWLDKLKLLKFYYA